MGSTRYKFCGVIRFAALQPTGFGERGLDWLATRHVTPKPPPALPVKGSGLLTILHPPPPSQPRPIGLAKAGVTVPEDFNPVVSPLISTVASARWKMWLNDDEPFQRFARPRPSR